MSSLYSQTDQDELSVEDESVNCVSSMITTLQYQACVSPVCEAAVLAELATGRWTRLYRPGTHIQGLCTTGWRVVGMALCHLSCIYMQALIQVSRFLGYTTMCGFLDDPLPLDARRVAG